MATEDSKLVAEGARVTVQKGIDPDRPLYNPQIKVGGVWVDVQRGDYQPHDFKSCVLCAMSAARGEDEPGVEVAWAVESYYFDAADDEGESESGVLVGFDVQHLNELTELYPGFDDLGDGGDEQLVRVVRHDGRFGEPDYVVQVRTGEHWISRARFGTVDESIAAARGISASLRERWEDEELDKVVWVDRGSLKLGD